MRSLEQGLALHESYRRIRTGEFPYFDKGNPQDGWATRVIGRQIAPGGVRILCEAKRVSESHSHFCDWWIPLIRSNRSRLFAGASQPRRPALFSSRDRCDNSSEKHFRVQDARRARDCSDQSKRQRAAEEVPMMRAEPLRPTASRSYGI